MSLGRILDVLWFEIKLQSSCPVEKSFKKRNAQQSSSLPECRVMTLRNDDADHLANSENLDREHTWSQCKRNLTAPMAACGSRWLRCHELTPTRITKAMKKWNKSKSYGTTQLQAQRKCYIPPPHPPSTRSHESSSRKRIFAVSICQELYGQTEALSNNRLSKTNTNTSKLTPMLTPILFVLLRFILSWSTFCIISRFAYCTTPRLRRGSFVRLHFATPALDEKPVPATMHTCGYFRMRRCVLIRHIVFARKLVIMSRLDQK